MYLAKHVYPTDSERATNEEASIRENEFSAGTLTNPRTQVTNQHSFRIRTRGAKGPYCNLLKTVVRHMQGSLYSGLVFLFRSLRSVDVAGMHAQLLTKTCKYFDIVCML